MAKKEEKIRRVEVQSRDSHICSLGDSQREERKWKGWYYQRNNVGMSSLVELWKLLHWQVLKLLSTLYARRLYQSMSLWKCRALGIKMREKQTDKPCEAVGGEPEREDSEYTMASNLTIATLDTRTGEQYFQNSEGYLYSI